MLAMSGEIDNFTKVNLDVTTLIALVSELTHGGCWYKFPEPLISELAEQERLQPLLPELNAFLQGRRMQTLFQKNEQESSDKSRNPIVCFV